MEGILGKKPIVLNKLKEFSETLEEFSEKLKEFLEKLKEFLEKLKDFLKYPILNFLPTRLFTTGKRPKKVCLVVHLETECKL